MGVSIVPSNGPATANAISRNGNIGTASGDSAGFVAQGLAASFTDLLRDANARLAISTPSGAGLIQRPDPGATTPQAEPTDHTRENDVERDDQSADRHAQAPQADRSGQNGDRTPPQAARHAQTSADDQTGSAKPADTGKPRRTNTSSSDNKVSGKKTTDKKAAGKKTSDGTDKADGRAQSNGRSAASRAPTAKADACLGAVPIAADTGAPSPAPTATTAAVQMPAASQAATASATGATAPQTPVQGKTAAGTPGKAGTGTPGQASTGKASTGTSGKAGTDAAGATPLPASAKTGGPAAKDGAATPDTTVRPIMQDSPTATPKAAAAPLQSQPAPQAPADPTVNAAANPADIKTQQTAALSKVSGDGNPIAVSSTVNTPAAQIVSHPISTLSAASTAAVAATATDPGRPATAATPAPAASPQPQVNPAAANNAVDPLAAQNSPLQAQAARADATAGDVAGTTIESISPADASGLQTASDGSGTLAGSGLPQAAVMPQGTGPQSTTTTQATAQARFSIPQQTAADQISVQITKAIKDGTDSINIQLRPEHLGRVDVHLEVSSDGRVQATVTADNKGTLNMLQRDARELLRSLQQAGLQTDSGSLNFNLRGQSGQGHDSSRQFASSYAVPRTATVTDEGLTASPILSTYPGGIRPDGRIDIRA